MLLSKVLRALSRELKKKKATVCILVYATHCATHCAATIHPHHASPPSPPCTSAIHPHHASPPCISTMHHAMPCHLRHEAQYDSHVHACLLTGTAVCGHDVPPMAVKCKALAEPLRHTHHASPPCIPPWQSHYAIHPHHVYIPWQSH